MNDITVKGKTYKFNKEIEMYAIKKFNQAVIDSRSAEDPDEVLLKAVMLAICPDMADDINFETWELNGQRLTYRESKTLLIDLRSKLDEYINAELEYLNDYIKGAGTEEEKNSQKVTVEA